MAIPIEFPFNTPTNYTYDPSVIDIALGQGNLVIGNNPGQTLTQDYANDTNFVYDPNSPRYAEVSGGILSQIDQRPTNATMGVTYTTDEDAGWGESSLTGTLLGSAAVSGGYLDTRNSATDGCSYPATGKYPTPSKGSIKLILVPNFTGGTANLSLFTIHSSGNGIITAYIDSAAKIKYALQGDSGANIFNDSSSIVGFSLNTPIELLFVWDVVAGTNKIFANGVQIFNNTSTGTRTNAVSSIVIGLNTSYALSMSGRYDDVITFSEPEHLTNYTPGYTVAETAFIASDVVEPEIQTGTLITADAFATTESGTPKFNIQLDQSGNFLYWDGAAFSTSDGTYAQSSSAADINTNIASLDVSNDTYIQFKVFFAGGNTQSSVTQHVLTYTGETYPTSDPTIEINSQWRIEELTNFIEDSTITGNDFIKYVLKKGTDWYYWDGAAWSISNDTYAQSSIAADILTNVATFTTENINFGVKLFLHSDTGATTPIIKTLTVYYDYGGETPDSIDRCIVSGFYDTDDPIKVKLSNDFVLYKTNRRLHKKSLEKIVYPDANYNNYWEVELIETANMTPTTYWNFDFNDKKIKSKNIPNLVACPYEDL